MTNEEILRRMGQLEIQRKPVEGTWDDIERYIVPLSGSFYNPEVIEAGKKWTTKEIWDSTGPIGASRLASFFWAMTVSPQMDWLKIGHPDPKVEKDPVAKTWLDETGRRLYNAITSSNFSLEMATGMLSWVGYGNFAITQEVVDAKRWRGFQFGGVPMRDIYFEEDWQGRVYRWFQKFKWTATQIVSKFTDPGTGKFIGPSAIEEQAKQSADDTKIEVIYCVFPRPGKKPMGMDEKMRAPLERPFGAKYVIRTGPGKDGTLGDETGFYEMPAYVGRYSRTTGSQWGFGPGLLALPTVKLVNALQEEIVNAAGKAVDPSLLVEERGLLGDVDLGRGGMTVVRDTSKSLVALESKARFDVSDNLLERQQLMIRKYFREDDISMKESPAMTATEVVQRRNLMNQLFGVPNGHLINDVLDPTTQTSFSTMYREGQIDKPPDIILEAAQKGTGLKIQYRGPLARAMRDDEVVAIERLLTAAYGALKMGFQDVTDEFSPAKALREMAERLDTPGAVWFTPQEAAANKQQRQKMQQAAQQAQIQKTQAEGNRAQAGADQMQQEGG
jgi:hypothetical protein